MVKKKKKKSTIQILEEKYYFLHEHHTIHFERSIKHLLRISHDRCVAKLSHQNFPAHSHHDHAIEPKERITLERITLARRGQSAPKNLFRLRVMSTYVSPRLSSLPAIYTRINARACARQAGTQHARTHARTHALDWIILEHEPRAMISMNTRCAQAARENEMSSADGKPWKKVVRSHGSLAGVVGAASRE